MKDIITELCDPSAEYRGHPFWSWNDKLDPDTLREQIREMKRVGLGGYFMHARGGLITEYLSDDWFDCTSTRRRLRRANCSVSTEYRRTAAVSSE